MYICPFKIEKKLELPLKSIPQPRSGKIPACYSIFSLAWTENVCFVQKRAALHTVKESRGKQQEKQVLRSPGRINNGRQGSFLSVSILNLRSVMAGPQSYCVTVKTVQSPPVFLKAWIREFYVPGNAPVLCFQFQQSGQRLIFNDF